MRERVGAGPGANIVEWLVAARLRLKLADNSVKGLDATDAEGRRYQIKRRRLQSSNGSLQLSVIRVLEANHVDFLIAVVMNADWTVRLAANIPHGALASLAQFRGHVNWYVLRRTLGILRIDGTEDLSRVMGEVPQSDMRE